MTLDDEKSRKKGRGRKLSAVVGDSPKQMKRSIIIPTTKQGT